MSLIINQGKFTVEQKLKMFDKFNHGIIDINGIPHIKIIRYNKEGFKSSIQRKHDFLEPNTGMGWKRFDSKGRTAGCFAFCRFEDRWALSGRETEFTIKYVTYIPLTTEVYMRNSVDKEGSHRLVDDPSVPNLSFVKLPITHMLERMKLLEEVIESNVSDDYQMDGLTHSRFCPFLACEIVLPEDVIDMINQSCPIFVFPNENLYLSTCMDTAKVIYEIFNTVIVPVMEKENIVLQLSYVHEGLQVYLKQTEYLIFYPEGKDIEVIRGSSYNSSLKEKNFHDIVKTILNQFKDVGYNITFTEGFCITKAGSSTFDRKFVSFIDFDTSVFISINKPLLDNIKDMLTKSNNEQHKQAVLLALEKHELDYIGMYPRRNTIKSNIINHSFLYKETYW